MAWPPLDYAAPTAARHRWRLPWRMLGIITALLVLAWALFAIPIRQDEYRLAPVTGSWRSRGDVPGRRIDAADLAIDTSHQPVCRDCDRRRSARVRARDAVGHKRAAERRRRRGGREAVSIDSDNSARRLIACRSSSSVAP